MTEPTTIPIDAVDTITPATFRELATPGRYRGIGSGTPFLLVGRAACSRFDDVFGLRTAWMEGVA